MSDNQNTDPNIINITSETFYINNKTVPLNNLMIKEYERNPKNTNSNLSVENNPVIDNRFTLGNTSEPIVTIHHPKK